MQNVVSFTSPALPCFPRTSRTSSVTGWELSSRTPRGKRVLKSHSVKSVERGEFLKFSILIMWVDTDHCLKCWFQFSDWCFSLLGGSFWAQPWCAGCRGCTSHLAPCSNTHLMLWGHQGRGKSIPVYGALSQTVHKTVLFSLNCKLVPTKEHCMATQLYVFPAFDCLLL